ncbi:GerAB/ArcD/ProY family transporter [Paenibacillus harenae]|uniref:Spore germination protein KB n=1 Tax=Paenibacillus harenae TaxID=306543 RepID=A0ABT9TVY7_PAEHA|nr:endospore germination permease [Paenibacillus harenae]MDQ0110873.1 spore germination protein KB [Paenibacillus harenae]
MKQRITTIQGIAILVNTIAPSAVLQMPAHIVSVTKQDAWLTVLLSMVVGLVYAYIVGRVCLLSNGKPLMEWLESRFGKAVALVIAVMLCGYYFMVAASVVRQFTNYVHEQLLNTTPMLAIALVIVFVSVYAVWQGIEAMGRMHFIVLLFSCLLMGLNSLLLWSYYDWANFLPIFEMPPDRHLSAVLIPAGWLSEISAVLFLLPYFKKNKQAARAAMWATLLSGSMILVTVVMIIAVFGVKIVNALSYPSFAALGIVEVGKFMERIDVFLLTAWMASMFAKVSIYLFIFFQLLSFIFRIRKKTSSLTALAVSAFISASSIYSWPRSSNFIEYIFTSLSAYLLVNNYALFLLIWGGLRLFKKKSDDVQGGAAT